MLEVLSKQEVPLAARSALSAMVCAVAAITVATSPAIAETFPPAGSVPPDQDPFYAAPANIVSYAPGQIVAIRPVSTILFGAAHTWQIAYRTNDAHDQPELTVTTLVVPTTPWQGQGARPIVSLQAAEDSVGIRCSPSYNIARNLNPDLGLAQQATTVGQDVPQALSFLVLGYAVAMPDHEGPDAEFGAGPQEGHATLDGIRAVHNFDTDGIGTANPVALYGYSGGAHATAWAAQLQPSYAPDLQLAGAANGGTPADPAEAARDADGGRSAGLEFAALFGIATAYPESGFTGVLNARGQQAFAHLRGKCLPYELAHFLFQKLADYSTVPDPLDVPSVKAVLTEDTLGAAAPTIPIYDYHAKTDGVDVGPDDTMVRNWCSQGATVDIVRDPVVGHVAEGIARLPSAVDYLSDRFAGKPAKSSCTT
jgi:hypothetical protein